VSIPKKQERAGERLLDVVVFGPSRTLRVHAGKRYLNLSGKDLEPFLGSRALRGSRLPRGFQNVDRLEVVE